MCQLKQLEVVAYQRRMNVDSANEMEADRLEHIKWSLGPLSLKTEVFLDLGRHLSVPSAKKD